MADLVILKYKDGAYEALCLGLPEGVWTCRYSNGEALVDGMGKLSDLFPDEVDHAKRFAARELHAQSMAGAFGSFAATSQELRSAGFKLFVPER